MRKVWRIISFVYLCISSIGGGKAPLRAPKSVRLLMPLPEVKFPLGKGMTPKEESIQTIIKSHGIYDLWHVGVSVIGGESDAPKIARKTK